MAMRVMTAAVVIVALIAAGPLRAERRLVEKSGFLSRSIWGTFAGFGFYQPDPRTNRSGAAQVMTGLRYTKPDYDDGSYHSIGYEVSASTLATATEDIFTVDAGVAFFYPPSQIFLFDHHLFWGAGIGQATVTRPRRRDEDISIGYVSGGVQARIRDWYLELFVKFIASGPDATFKPDGSVVALQGTYHFNP